MLPDRARRWSEPFVHAIVSSDHFAASSASPSTTRFFQKSFVKPLPPVRARPLRIAYLSTDFQQHATAQLMVQMLEAHDRSRVEITDFRLALTTVRRCASAPSAPAIGSGSACHSSRRWRGASARSASTSWSTKGRHRRHVAAIFRAARRRRCSLNWLARFPHQRKCGFHRLHVGDIVTPLGQRRAPRRIAQPPNAHQPNDAHRCRPRQPRAAPRYYRPRWRFRGLRLPPVVQDPEGVMNALVRAGCSACPAPCLWLLGGTPTCATSLLAAAAGIGSTERLRLRRCCRWSSTSRGWPAPDVILRRLACNAHTTAGGRSDGVLVVTIPGDTFAQRVGASLLHRSGWTSWCAPTKPATSRRSPRWLPMRRAAPLLRERLERERATARCSTANASRATSKPCASDCGRAVCWIGRRSMWQRGRAAAPSAEAGDRSYSRPEPVTQNQRNRAIRMTAKRNTAFGRQRQRSGSAMQCTRQARQSRREGR